MDIYIVSYLEVNEFGDVSFNVDQAFEKEEAAAQYCKQQTGSDPRKICYIVNEAPFERQS